MVQHGVARASAAIFLSALLSVSCAGQPPAAEGPASGVEPGASAQGLDIRPGRGVSGQYMLSRYLPSLEGGPGDSPVFVLDSGQPGATLLVVAGTHANEIAGMAAAAMIVERATPTRGRLIVVPYLNSSGLGYSEPDNPQPPSIRLEAASGARAFRYGARLVSPEHQGADDPESYIYPGSSVRLAGEEQRNINRAYPGLSEGPLAQRVAAAVMAIIREEGVDIAVDMHEARPTSKLKWMIVANPRSVDIAVGAIFDLEDRGIDMKLDRSSDEWRGLSHREWGDYRDTKAFLVETVNPAQATNSGTAVDQLRHPDYPLWRRVAVQLEALGALVDNFNSASATESVEFSGLPDYASLERLGLEAFY